MAAIEAAAAGGTDAAGGSHRGGLYPDGGHTLTE